MDQLTRTINLDTEGLKPNGCSSVYEEAMFSEKFTHMLIAKLHDHMVTRIKATTDAGLEDLLDDLCMLFIIQGRTAEGRGRISYIDNNQMIEMVRKLSHSLDWDYEWGQEQP